MTFACLCVPSKARGLCPASKHVCGVLTRLPVVPCCLLYGCSYCGPGLGVSDMRFWLLSCVFRADEVPKVLNTWNARSLSHATWWVVIRFIFLCCWGPCAPVNCIDKPYMLWLQKDWQSSVPQHVTNTAPWHDLFQRACGVVQLPAACMSTAEGLACGGMSLRMLGSTEGLSAHSSIVLPVTDSAPLSAA